MLNKSIPVIQLEDCCQPAAQLTISREQAQNAAELFTALADPTRLAILNMLAASASEVCVCDITSSFPLGQPTISHHLRLLKEAGLVKGDKRGKWVYYSLVERRLGEVRAVFDTILPQPMLVK